MQQKGKESAGDYHKDSGQGSAWCTEWTAIPPGPVPKILTRADYRSRLPASIQDVATQFRPVVKQGQWTTGLWECWKHKHRHDHRTAVKLGAAQSPNETTLVVCCVAATSSLNSLCLTTYACLQTRQICRAYSMLGSLPSQPCKSTS